MSDRGAEKTTSDRGAERTSGAIFVTSLEWKVFSLARNVFAAAGIYCRDDLAAAVTGHLPEVGSPEFYPPAEVNAPARVDRRGLYKLFELAVALEFRVLPWESVPPEVLVAAGARRNKNNGALPDCGVDCASADLKTQVQAKWYRPGGRVPFTAVGTFGMYAEHLGAEERILVSSPGVKFSYPAGNIRSIRYATLTPERVVELLAPAFNFNFRLEEPELESSRRVSSPPRLNSNETVNLSRETVGPLGRVAPAVAETLTADARASPPAGALRPMRIVVRDGRGGVVPAQQMQPVSRFRTTRAPVLRPYQEEALATIQDACAEGGVHSVVMACGTGKTVIVARLALLLLAGMKSGVGGCRFAILVPSLQLVSRFTAELAIWAPGIEYEIVKGGIQPAFDKPLLICVNNSARKIAAYNFDVVVVDEAHHVQGWDPEDEDGEPNSDDNSKEYSDESEEDSDGESSSDEASDREDSQTEEEEDYSDSDIDDSEESDSVGDSFSGSASPAPAPEDPDESKTRSGFLRVASGLKCKTRLDFTATPKSGKTPRVSLGLRDAIEAGILVDYWIDVPVFENSDTPEEKAANRKPNLARLVAEHPEWTRVLAYCNTVAEAEVFAGLLRERGVPAVSFSGKTPVPQRERLIRQFEGGEFRALVTVNVLGEGVDIPCADCCMFVEPRGSRINVIQCIGRVLRKAPGKTRSVVVLPTTEEEEFGVLRRFFSIIMDEDRTYRQWCDTSNRRGETRGRIELNYSAGETVHCSSKEINNNGTVLLREDVYSRLGEALVSAWVVKLELLRDFVAEHGRLPTRFEKYREEQIGLWVHNQRTVKKLEKIADERAKMLEEIPGWTWGFNRGDINVMWDSQYKLLKEFTRKNNRLPKRSESYLGSWISQQRTGYKKGKIHEERIRSLEEIPEWSWGMDSVNARGNKTDNWEIKFGLLLTFVAENQRLPKFSEIYKNNPLGHWINKQRTAYKNGKMETARAKALEEIDRWSWGVDHVRSRGDRVEYWKKHYELLEEFVSKNARLPKRLEIYCGEDLGKWVNLQRIARKKDKLITERIQLLERIPGWSWGADNPKLRGKKLENWNIKYTLTLDFVAKNNRLPTESINLELARWIRMNRRTKKSGKLSEERIKLLEAIPHWSWGVNSIKLCGPPINNWNIKYATLQDFIVKYGRLPKQSESYKNEALGLWISNQRQAKKRGKLCEGRAQLLEAIPQWVWKVK